MLKTLIFSLVILWPSLQAYGKTKVALMVFLDLSATMKDHRIEVAKLAQMVDKAMKQGRCEYKVAVSNVAYDDNDYNDMTPIGTPAFVTRKTPGGFEKIRKRILSPETVSAGYRQGDGTHGLPSGESELTYSSVVYGVEQNQVDLQNQDAVGTLLVTDAAPGFETMPPEAALSRIRQAIGSAAYMPGVIGHEFYERMPVYKGNGCDPDFPAVSYAVGTDQGIQDFRTLPIQPGRWKSKDIHALKSFARKGGGWHWNICEPDYENAVQEFLIQLMDMAGCLHIV